MSNTPSNAIPYVPQNTLDPAAGLNNALNVIDAVLNTRVVNMTTSTPPLSPTDGDMYIVMTAGTGDWSGHDNALARYVADGTFWQFYEAGVQAWLVINLGNHLIYGWDAGAAAWRMIGAVSSEFIPFNPDTASGLTSTNVQDALNELGARP